MTKKKASGKAAKKAKPTSARLLKNRPLDPSEDFDKGTKKEPESQPELLNIPKQSTPAVQHDRMSAHFIGFQAKRTKNRDRVVTMKFSLELEEEHSGRIPREIEDEWKHFKRGGIKTTTPDGIPTQNVALAMSSDGTVDLEIIAAVPKAVISRIVQKGKGASRKVTRLEMHFLTAYSQDTEHFCRNNYDETTWLKVEESQRTFGENEEAEG